MLGPRSEADPSKGRGTRMAEICWMGGGIYVIWAWFQFVRDAEYEIYLTADAIVCADLSHPYQMRGELAGHWLDSLGSFLECDCG